MATVTSTELTDLQEFSSYTVTITARFDAFGHSNQSHTTSVNFTTLSAGKLTIVIYMPIICTIAPTRSPHNLTYSVTSGSIIITWDTIECIERNGVITDYTVVFQEQGGAVIPGEVNVMDRTFTASGLTPHTNYTFRVAGVNINGTCTGPFSDSVIILTHEEGIVLLANV